MSKLNWLGLLKGKPWYENSKHFKPLYEAVNRLYPQMAGKAGSDAAVPLDPDLLELAELPGMTQLVIQGLYEIQAERDNDRA